MVDDVAYDIIRLFCEKNAESDSSVLTDSDIRAEIIRAFQKQIVEKELTEEDIIECMDDIADLADAGKLFTQDVFKPSAGLLKAANSPIKALCLHVSHACDLTCSYCFAGQGRFNGPASLMSEEVGKKAIDFLIENSGTRHNLEVDFFGGEPLLNFEVVKNIVSYAREREKEANKNFRFTLTTNGMGITDEIIDFANRECHNVVLSLDGRPEIHDRERRTGSGEGSYSIIVPKFQRLVAARTGKDCGLAKISDIPDWVTKGTETGNTSYYMRGTFTHFNPDFTEDIFHMTDLGFTELSMEPVVTSPDSPFALTEGDKTTLFEQYEVLAKEMINREREGRPFTFYHYMLDLTGGPCIYKRLSGCGSGTEYFAVTPQGDLYPCHQFVGESEYKMGDIWKGIDNLPKYDEFRGCNVYSRTECDDCWARLYCSGGCAANSYHSTGSILGTYKYGCDLFKKRIECAIMMNIAELN